MITINEIKERIRFLKKEQVKSGTSDIVLDNLFESSRCVGTTLTIAGSSEYAVMAGYVHSLDACCLIGWIPEEYTTEMDCIKASLSFFSDGRINEKQMMIFRDDGESTKILIRFDQEILENILDWLSTMIAVCGMLIIESSSKN